MQRSYTPIGVNPTVHKCSTIYGISQGEKYADDFRPTRKFKYKYGNRHFWCRGYYVDTVGRNKKVIEKYIQNQLEEDYANDQVSIKEYIDPFTGNKNK